MSQPKSRTPWIVCGVIALLIVCGGLGLLGAFGVLAYIGKGSEGISLQLNSPSSVSAGEDFRVVVTVANQGSQTAQLDRIDLSQSLAQKAQVSQVEPQAQAVNGNSYTFDLPIDPGESQQVTFWLNAVEAGDISGEITVVSGNNTSSASIDLSVAAAAAAPTEIAEAPTEAVKVSDPASTGEIAGVPYKAVVQILALVNMEGELTPGWSGSGSIVSPDGLILTNAHVVLSDRYFEVQDLVVAMTIQTDQQPEPMYYAEMMQVDQALDIAVIRITHNIDGSPVDNASLNLPTVPMGDDAALQLGDPLTILGYPSIGGSTITLTRGEVAGFTAEEGYGNRAFIKTSATISGGNSGGLAANANGQIIGIPTQLGYGGEDQYVDCRVLADTNRDGIVDDRDNCVPTGGFINALRPLTLARPLIEAAARGEIDIKEGVEGEQGSIPDEGTAQVLFSDDFSDPNSGWDDTEWEDGAVHYTNGEYQVTVIPQQWLVWSYLGEEYDDVILSVDTRAIEPTGVGDYGLICRLVDDDNFYAFEVSEDGYFSIWKEINGEVETLYDWEYSDAIPMDGAFTINAACAGNRLLMGVNDLLLADITDEDLVSGKVGLLVGTLDQGGLVVGFDNFVVQAP